MGYVEDLKGSRHGRGRNRWRARWRDPAGRQRADAGSEAAVQRLVEHANEGGALRWGTEQETSTSRKRVGEMLQLIASLREFQYC